MTTCVNCDTEAIYTYQVSADYRLHYCQYHLPRFLFARRDSGELPLIVDAPEPEKPAKKTKTVAEDVTVEVTDDATN
jgi:hypothetical protein